MTRCDTHIHVVDDLARYPMVASRTYTPPPATIETLQALGQPLGIERFVVVQPSFYGTDNTLLLAALQHLGARGAGVAVVDPATISEAELAALAGATVRGLRLNLYSTHGAPSAGLADRFTATAKLAERMGWHVQIIAQAPVLAEAGAMLARAAVPVVIDHYGLPEAIAPASDTGRRLLDLVRAPHVWVKLSAPYRWTGDPLGIRPDPDWLAALLEAALDRCVWGSDWPHTPAHEAQPGGGAPLPYRPIDYAALVTAFRAALPDAGLAERIMGANPARLYGFAG